ncbi:MAG: TonB-dependent receptor [Chloracidobacterium sp.]|nr:TonB-dependent receptor [Chloracidobacterium sp.]
MNIIKLIRPPAAPSERPLRRPKILAALAFCLCLFSSGAVAQITGSTTLRGVVKDEKGALLTDATVTLVNEATKVERKTTTNREGIYVLSSLLPGTYSISVERSGFKKSEQTNLILNPSDTRSLDFTLQIGAASETVTVTATAEVLQTETGAKENTITAKQIENLSIISRSSLELLRILPGVVAPDGTELQSVSFGGGANANANYHVNGLRGENNTVTVDGARMMDIGSNNGTIVTANPDMVQEVKVQTSNYAAEHGTSSVLINATTKGGSSAYHGSIYDYSRDYRLAANDRSNSIQGIDKPSSQYNYPGGNIGGPLTLPRKIFGPLGGLNEKKDKLFFFAGFEYYYQRDDEGSHTATVPTLKMRQGDFSEIATLKDAQGVPLPQSQQTTFFGMPRADVTVPSGCNAPGYVPGELAPNNNLTPCLDPTGLGAALMNSYPAPNFTDPTGFRNYVYSVLRPNDRNQFTARFDYNLSEKTKLYVRLAREYETQGFPRGLWWNSADYQIPGDLKSDNLGRSVVVNLTNVISPTMTNEVLFGASKLKLNYDYADPSKVSLASLGVQKIGALPNRNPYLPVGVTPWGDSNLGNLDTAYGFPILAWNDTFTVTDNLTKVYNSHTLKFGAFIEQANKRQQSDGDINIELAQWNRTGGTGTDFGDLYTGHPIEVTTSTDRPLDNFRYYNYEFYAQDSWKVRPSFTLEYGLRVAYLPNNFERKGLGVLFDPKAYNPASGVFINGNTSDPNGILTAASGQIPKGVLSNNPPQLMPRLNFAWDVGGKGSLVIRAGAGLFYNRVQGNYDYYSSGQMPNTYHSTVNVFGDAGLTFANLSNVDPFSALATLNLNSRDPNSNNIPRVANMSLTIEKRLPKNNILTVAYVGTQGRHLPQQKQIDFVPLGAMLSGTIVPTAQQVADSSDDKNPNDCRMSLTSAACQQLIVARTVNLANPVDRVAVDSSITKQFKPYPAYNSIGYYQFTGTSSYHSLQATLSRQTGKLNYFATYTFSKAMGTVATNESDGSAWADPIDTRGRSWGVLPFDRTHILNLSYNYQFPDLAHGKIDNKFMRGVLNGWQMSGITTFQSGTPVRLKFSGAIATTNEAIAWYGSDAFAGGGTSTASVGAIAPVYLKNPTISTKDLGAKIFNISDIAIPGFAQSGPSQPPFYMRFPSRSNFDVSFFKNFKISESKTLQFRSGFFNIFNQAYPTQYDVTNSNNSDIYLTLNTVCNRMVSAPNGLGGTSNVCDPTGGFSFDQTTMDKFGMITNKRGHRIIELALKFNF